MHHCEPWPSDSYCIDSILQQDNGRRLLSNTKREMIRGSHFNGGGSGLYRLQSNAKDPYKLRLAHRFEQLDIHIFNIYINTDVEPTD